MRTAPIVALAGVLLLGACGSKDQASTLRDAANQSDPAAAAVLQNEANNVDAQGATGSEADANSAVQQAMQNAGDAAASTAPPAPSPNGPTAGAKPHGAKDSVPPPQTNSSPPQGGR